jgi:hypothetical protein
MALHTRLFATLVALVAVALPAGAFAQSAAPDAPSYASAAPSYGTANETIHGRISSFDGAYNLQVRDERGFMDNVQLQQGTVINPTGIRLAAGMAVTIHGVNRGTAFAANQIDTPYQSYGLEYPAYPYGVYPYPVYGYPYSRVSIGFGFGGFHRGFR